MSCCGRENTEISGGECLDGLVDHMDAAAGHHIDDLEISMGVFRDLQGSRFE